MDVVASNNGLAFSISPSKKRPKKQNEDDDEEYTLTLAPFTKPPKISFGEVKVNTMVERTVLIVNPQDFDVKLNVTNQDLEINNLEVSIGKQENVYFKIKWQPEKPNNYKYSIMFEVTNSARLKFLVHAFGVCVAPPQKKIRKPLTMFQPVKKEKPATTNATSATEKTVHQVATTNKPNKFMSAKSGVKENNPTKKVSNSITATIKSACVPANASSSATATTFQDKTFLVQQQKQIQNPEINFNSFPRYGNNARLSKTPSVDIYSLYDNIDDEEDQDGTLQTNAMDLRRQTCIIASPKILKNKDGTFKFVTVTNSNATGVCADSFSNNNYNMRNIYMDNSNFKINDFQKTPHRRSLSSSNLDTSAGLSFVDHTLVVVAGGISQNNHFSFSNVESNQTVIQQKNYSPSIFSTVKKQTPEYTDNNAVSLTPKLSDFIKQASLISKQNNKTQKQPSLATQLIYDCEEYSRQKDSEQIFNSTTTLGSHELPLKVIVQLQKQWRMRRFRNFLRELKISMAQDAIRAALANTQIIIAGEREKEQKIMIRGLVKLQLHFRMKRFRHALTQLKQTRYNDKLLCSVLIVQRKWRIIKFRKHVRAIKIQRELEESNRVNLIVICQRRLRMKLFRIHLNKLKEHRILLVKHAINCQRALRMKRFRSSLKKMKANEIMINKSALKIQHQWRLFKFRKQMKIYRNAAVHIQRWVRVMKNRFIHLRLKRGIVFMQKKIRLFLIKRNRAALTIQSWYRAKMCIRKYKKNKTSALIIQRWFRSKTDRISYLKWKRNRIPLQLQINAAVLIQRKWRLHKFRSQMRIYRQAAAKIQIWHRSMKLRYEFMRKRDAICRIQALYRRVYMVRRQSAALRIQCAWRMLKALKIVQQKRIEYLAQMEAKKEENRLNYCATTIQAYWKGYIVRKQTGKILNRIRNRLSVYGQNISLSNYQAKTLGARIRSSLKILSSANVPIPQILLSLVDLDKVTQLSQECCQIFVREGALITLYNFILNCNRSMIHMDLIKLCLKIFINLAKYNETVFRIMEPNESLFILSNLLSAYHSSNAIIFMDACILFILLAQCEPLKEWLISQDHLIKKLLQIHSTLERKTILKIKHSTQKTNFLSANSVSAQQSLNTTISSSSSTQSALTKACTLTSNKKSLVVMFTMQPDWSLSKKSTIELVDPIGALEFLLDCLKVKIETTALKTPKKAPVLNIVKELSCTSSTGKKKDLDGSANTTNNKVSATSSRIPLSQRMNRYSSSENKPTKSVRELDFKIKTNHNDENNENEPDMTMDEQHMSICSNESYISNTTIKSITSSFFGEDPKLNSTSISSFVMNMRPQIKKKQTEGSTSNTGPACKN